MHDRDAPWLHIIDGTEMSGVARVSGKYWYEMSQTREPCSRTVQTSALHQRVGSPRAVLNKQLTTLSHETFVRRSPAPRTAPGRGARSPKPPKTATNWRLVVPRKTVYGKLQRPTTATNVPFPGTEIVRLTRTLRQDIKGNLHRPELLPVSPIKSSVTSATSTY